MHEDFVGADLPGGEVICAAVAAGDSGTGVMQIADLHPGITRNVNPHAYPVAGEDLERICAESG